MKKLSYRIVWWTNGRGALIVLFAIMTTALSAGVEAGDAPASVASPELAAESALRTDNVQPVISLDEVLNATSSTEGPYPVHSYGLRPMFMKSFFWMDNRRIILNDAEKTEKENYAELINIWDVDRGKSVRYASGSVACYADGKIHKTLRTGPTIRQPRDRYKGPLGEETIFLLHSGGERFVYIRDFECGELPSPLTVQHVRDNPDERVVALRAEHGFLAAAATKKILSGGKTRNVFHSDEVVLHRPGKKPKKIPIPFNTHKMAYYPFVDVYVFYSSPHKIYLLLPHEGEVIIEEKPAGLPGRVIPVLTRRGILWFHASVPASPENGFYLVRGGQIKKISSENARDGMVSPDGCRVAYNTVRFDITGALTLPALKVTDLCKGEK